MKIKLLIIIGLLIPLNIIFIADIKAQKNNKEKAVINVNIEDLGTRLALVGLWPVSDQGKSYKKIKFIKKGKTDFNISIDRLYKGKMVTWNMLFKVGGWPPLGQRSKRIDFYINQGDTIRINGKMKKYSIDYTNK